MRRIAKKSLLLRRKTYLQIDYMAKLQILQPLLLLLLTTAACTDRTTSYPTEIVALDSLSATQPKVALARLDSLSTEAAHYPARTAAYYHLVRTKAADRAYVRHTSDSLILTVVDYYEQHPESDLLAWAYCYAGRVCRDLHDAPRALSYFHRALDVLPPDGDDALRSSLLSQVGYIYYSQQLYAESADAKRHVIRLDSLKGSYDRMSMGYKDLAQCHLALNQPDSALLFAQRAMQLATEHQSLRRIPEIRLIEARIAMLDDDFTKAMQLLEPCLTDTLIANLTPYLAAANRAAEGLGDTTRIRSFSDQILASPSANAHARYAASRSLLGLAREQHRHADLLHYQELCIQLLDSISALDNAVDVKQISALYDYQLRERDNQRLRIEMQRDRIVSYSIIALLTLIVIILWLLVSRRRLHTRLQNTLADLFNIAYRQSDIYATIMSHIDSQLPLNDQDWQQVNALFEQHLPDFQSKLRRSYDFTTIEWRITLLTRLGIRNVDIATLVCKHPSTITHSKKRLCLKVLGIEDGKAEQWDEFIIGG